MGAGMNSQEFREAAHKAVEQSELLHACVLVSRPGKLMLELHCAVIDYYETIEGRRVTPEIQPGYLRPLLPDAPPQEGEAWDVIQKDLTDKIMPGLTHW